MFLKRRKDWLKLGRFGAGMLLVGILLLVGSLMANPSEIKISFWKAPASPNEAEIWMPVIAKFEKENPGIKIVLEVTPWAGWSEKYTAAFAGDNPPDVSYMPDSYFPKYAKAGKLVDLGKTGWTKQVKENFDESILKGSQYKGVQYGIPLYGTPHLLYWNKLLFAEAGIPGPPTNWEEFVEDAEKLTEGDVYGFGMVATAAQYNYVWFYTFLFSAGVQIVDELGTRAMFNTPDGVYAAQFVADLFNKYKVCPPAGAYNYDQLGDMFCQGKLAMNIFNPMLMVKLSKFPETQYGITVPPKWRKVAAFGDWGHMFIAQKSKNKEAAWKFVKFITDKWAVEQYVVAAQLPPARKGIEVFKDNPNMQVFLDNLSIFQPSPIHPKLYQINITVGEAVEEVIMGVASAEEAFAKAEKKVNEILAEE